VPVAGGVQWCSGYSRSSRSQDGESERRGSERSAGCAQRACPEHHCTPPATTATLPCGMSDFLRNDVDISSFLWMRGSGVLRGCGGRSYDAGTSTNSRRRAARSSPVSTAATEGESPTGAVQPRRIRRPPG
jgi:hypothetical protein